MFDLGNIEFREVFECSIVRLNFPSVKFPYSESRIPHCRVEI